MAVFGWVAEMPEPPERWDLRQHGWTLCHGDHGSRMNCQHVLVIDTCHLQQDQRLGLAQADHPAWRLIMLGVEQPGHRAALLSRGCAEALPQITTLRELAARARRVADMFGSLPRWRSAGPLVLDLFHRDGRLGNRWLALHPREFSLLWRLTDAPGERVTRSDLLRDVWRIQHDPQTNSVEVHVSRLRSKLAQAGCAALIETVPEGGYRLAKQMPFMLADGAPTRSAEQEPHSDALDRYVRLINWRSQIPSEAG